MPGRWEVVWELTSRRTRQTSLRGRKARSGSVDKCGSCSSADAGTGPPDEGKPNPQKVVSPHAAINADWPGSAGASDDMGLTCTEKTAYGGRPVMTLGRHALCPMAVEFA